MADNVTPRPWYIILDPETDAPKLGPDGTYGLHHESNEIAEFHAREDAEYAFTAVNSHDALVEAARYIPEQVDLNLPRFKDADDSETVAIEITIGWLREVRDALELAEGRRPQSRS